MAIDLNENGDYKYKLSLKKKDDKKKIVAVLSGTTKIIVTDKNYNKYYLYKRFKQFFGRNPDEREKQFIIKNNRFKNDERNRKAKVKMGESY